MRPTLEMMVTGPALEMLKKEKKIKVGDWVLLGDVKVSMKRKRDGATKMITTNLSGRIRRVVTNSRGPGRIYGYDFTCHGHGQENRWWFDFNAVLGWYPGELK